MYIAPSAQDFPPEFCPEQSRFQSNYLEILQYQKEFSRTKISGVNDLHGKVQYEEQILPGQLLSKAEGGYK